MEIQVPLMTIDVAVAMRNLSALKDEREMASRMFSGPTPGYQGDQTTLIAQIRAALYAAMILTYAQGMNQLYVAAQKYGYEYQLEDVARIWRGGCIIRADLLEIIRSAFQKKPHLSHLWLDENLGKMVEDRQEDLRKVVQTSAQHLGIWPAWLTSMPIAATGYPQTSFRLNVISLEPIRMSGWMKRVSSIPIGLKRKERRWK
jgi:6-phosphogluconate dehydrogenase